MTAPEAKPFTVLVVCTANQYRSPLGEFFLRSGTDCRGGSDPPALTRETALRWIR
jgi:hypothetical protein